MLWNVRFCVNFSTSRLLLVVVACRICNIATHALHHDDVSHLQYSKISFEKYFFPVKSEDQAGCGKMIVN